MRKEFENFNKGALKNYSDPHKYVRVWEKALWVLNVVSNECEIGRLNCNEISSFLTNVIEIDTSYQAVRYAMNNLKRGLVNGSRSGFKIMEKGRKEIESKKQNIDSKHIKPGEQLSSKALFCEQILSKLRGEVRICDPYIGPRLLDLLLNIDKKHTIKILTTQVEDKPAGIFSRALSDIKKEGYDIEIKIYNKSELHDRYIIDGNQMWLVGHSIKDLGNKESFVINVGKDMKDSALSTFNRRWKISSNSI